MSIPTEIHASHALTASILVVDDNRMNRIQLSNNLKLQGYDMMTIKKLGRWSSDTYLLYIQSQIANLTQGIAERMARPLTFHLVA